MDCGLVFRARNDQVKRCFRCSKKHHNQLSAQRQREKRMREVVEDAPLAVKEYQSCQRCKQLAECRARIWDVRYLPPCCSPEPITLHEKLTAGLEWNDNSKLRSRMKVNRAMDPVGDTP
jgi:hypothetical protein